MTALAEFRDVLSDKRFVGRFNAARTDPDLKIAAERAFALERIKADARLAACSPASIHNALLDVAFVGLSLSPVLGYCYLIAYRNKDETFSASVKVSYRGLLCLCYRAQSIKGIQAVTVHENDPVFKVRRTIVGTDLEHIEARKDRGRITHAYSVATFATGGHHVEIMDADQLSAVERFARSKGGGQAWSGPFREEMCKKAVIRRAWKYYPSDPALAHAAAAMDRVEPVSIPREVINGEAVELVSKKQVSTLVDMATAHEVSLPKLCAALNVESLDKLPADRFDEAAFVAARR